MSRKQAKILGYLFLAGALVTYAQATGVGIREGYDIWRMIGTYIGLTFKMIEAGAALLVGWVVIYSIYCAVMDWNKPNGEETETSEDLQSGREQPPNLHTPGSAPNSHNHP